MTVYNTTREVMQALLDGKKVKIGFEHEDYIHLVGDMLFDNKGDKHPCTFGFEKFGFYEEYIEET